MREPLTVLAPFAGQMRALAATPDPAFAQGLLGPGLCIDPDRTTQTVLAPVAGVVTALRPHAFVVRAIDSRDVLVHLGVDTVNLAGAGFRVLVAEGEQVAAGAPVLKWDPAGVAGAGLSPLAPLVALQAPPAQLSVLVAEGERVTAGQPVLEWA